MVSRVQGPPSRTTQGRKWAKDSETNTEIHTYIQWNNFLLETTPTVESGIEPGTS